MKIICENIGKFSHPEDIDVLTLSCNIYDNMELEIGFIHRLEIINHKHGFDDNLWKFIDMVVDGGCIILEKVIIDTFNCSRFSSVELNNCVIRNFIIDEKCNSKICNNTIIGSNVVFIENGNATFDDNTTYNEEYEKYMSNINIMHNENKWRTDLICDYDKNKFNTSSSSTQTIANNAYQPYNTSVSSNLRYDNSNFNKFNSYDEDLSYYSPSSILYNNKIDANKYKQNSFRKDSFHNNDFSFDSEDEFANDVSNDSDSDSDNSFFKNNINYNEFDNVNKSSSSNTNNNNSELTFSKLNEIISLSSNVGENNEKNEKNEMVYDSYSLITIPSFEKYNDYEEIGVNFIKFKDGSVYEGTIMDSLMHGEGKLTCTNGIVYNGYWINGKKNGIFYYCVDNHMIVQEYTNDMKNGISKIFNNEN